MSSTKTQAISIIAIPFPGQSHLNQLLHFSLILSSRNLPVHFAAPPSSIHQAQLRLRGWPSSSLLNIHFHPLPLPPPSPPPLPPSLRLFDTPLLLRPSLSPLLLSLSLSSRRLIILHDTFMSFAALDAASLPNAESYTFQCVSAFQALFELHRARAPPHPLLAAEFEDWVPTEILERVKRLQCETSLDNAGIVANSCRPLDGDFVDILQKEFGSRRVFAVSPLHLMGPRLAVGLGERDECLVWLDKQPVASVVYVSFGSTTTMGDAQVEQLAIGLRRSGQRFIWVLREADKGAITTEANTNSESGGLPPGFEDAIQSRGIITRGWAPQVEILAHPSTAAFMSHCGWNSTMESLSSGVPIIAWPMQLDQPRNAMLLAEHLKAGVLVREWGRRKAVVSAARVEEVVRMMAAEEGRGMRERAREIGEEIRRAVADGGSSMADLNAFVAHITR